MSADEGAAHNSSLGARLRAARERAGLTLAVVADKLHCDLSIIAALEAERFNELGGAVYARGHVRRYAELVGESSAELQELFVQSVATSSHLPDLTRAPKAERPADPRSLVAPVAATAIAMLVAAAIWWVVKGHVAPPGATDTSATATTATATRGTTTSTTVRTPLPAAPRTRASGVAIDVVAVPEHGLTAASAAAVGLPPTGGGAFVVSPTPRPLQLRLTSSADCWIEAYDEHGKRIYFGMASPNSVQQINGSAPLRILLGNVAAVTLEIDGHVTPVPESLRRGSSAWFEVAADGKLNAAADLGNAPVNGDRRPSTHSKDKPRASQRRPSQR